MLQILESFLRGLYNLWDMDAPPGTNLEGFINFLAKHY